MREGWTSTALKNVCAVDKAKHYGKTLPYVGLEHIESGTGRFIGSSEPAVVKSATFSFTANHLLYGRLRPYLNKVLLPDFEGHCSSEIFPLRVKSSLDRRFLYYWLTWEPVVKEIDKTSTGARMPRANVSKLLEFELPLPPLSEQNRIVAILDEAFAGIATAVANTEKNLANARELFESYLSLVLLDKHWQWRKLGDLCHGFEYGSSAKSKKLGMVPVVRMGNIQGGQISWQDLVYSDNQEEIQRYLLKPNDVLFNRTNSPELVGKTGVYKDQRPAIFAGYLIRINRIEDQLDADFLNYFLNSKIASDYGSTVVTSSVNQANINATKLSGYPIPAPPLTEQKRIVGRLNELQGEIHRIEQIYQHKLASFAELKQSLLQIAFSGELTTASRNEIETAVA